MIKMAVDAGFGRVKAMADSGSKFEFPSVIGEFRPVHFVSGMESDVTSRLVIEYRGKQRFIGEAALKQSVPQNTIDKERTITEEGLALLVAAMSLLAPGKLSDNYRLIVGLPVMHYEALKGRYLSEVLATHVVGSLSLSGMLLQKKYFAIEQAKVLPQPLGTLFDCLLDDYGDLVRPELAKSKIGVIDIGYNTLDLARADNLEYINPRSTSFSGLGMFAVFQSLSMEIYKSYGIEIPPERVEPVFKSGQIRVAGKLVNIEYLKQIALKEAASQVISRVKSVWPDRWELDYILVTGGGAIVLGEYLKNEFGDQVIMVNNPSFANVAGYLKFGQRIWKS